MLTSTQRFPDINKRLESLATQGMAENHPLLQEEFGLYLPPSASYSPLVTEGNIDLDRAVERFLREDKKVFLLLGESGSGKSLFGQILARQLLQHYQPGQFFPLFFSLPAIGPSKNNPLCEALKRYHFSEDEIKYLQKHQSFLLIFDAYDEWQRWENLYHAYHLNEWQSKIMVTCRPSYLAQVDHYLVYFAPLQNENCQAAVLEEIYIMPFSTTQIGSYIRKYLQVKDKELHELLAQNPHLSKEWLQPETYHHWINQIENLNTLVRSPFLLKITMQVLPSIVSEYQKAQSAQEHFRMTGAKLYDVFINEWFSRQEAKLILSNQHPGRPTLQQDYRAYAKALAKKMKEKKLTQVTFDEQSLLDFEENPVASPPNEWAPFFSDDMLPMDKQDPKRQQIRILCRKACPLQKVGPSQYAFIHASFLDYFAAQGIYDSALSQASSAREKNIVSAMPGQKQIRSEEQTREELVRQHRLLTSYPLLQGNEGAYAYLKNVVQQEQDELAQEEGMKVNEKNVLLGKGNYGELRLIRQVERPYRFAVLKKVKGVAEIKNSQDEARIQQQLKGQSHVMPLWDFFERPRKHFPQQNALCHVMPLAGFGNGAFFRQSLRSVQDAALKESFWVHFARGLLTGVSNLHLNCIYHQDIKPANVVMDIRGAVYLIDFGCAVLGAPGQEDLIKGGKGSVPYFSPERLEARKQARAGLPSPEYDGAKADAWAVGLTLLEIKEGFPFEEVADIHEIFQTRDWRYFETELGQREVLENPQDDGLWAVVKRLLSVDPHQRLRVEQALKMPVFQRKELRLESHTDMSLQRLFEKIKADTEALILQESQEYTTSLSSSTL